MRYLTESIDDDRYYFEINDDKLAKKFAEDYPIYMDDLGPFGGKTGTVESFDIDDAYFDCEEIEDCIDVDELNDEQRETLEDSSYLTYDDAKYIYPDIDKDWDLEDTIVVFDRSVGQSEQNFLQWDRCIGDLYCDLDDLNEFLEDYPEYRTEEMKIDEIVKLIKEYDIDPAKIMKRFEKKVD